MPLDEAARRRDTFRGGTPVRMADGQEWQLPDPFLRFVPSDDDVGFETRVSLDDDGTFARLMAALRETPGFKAGLAVGRYLLLLNYDLTPAEVADVLQFGTDPEGERVTQDVLDVAWGNGPKRSADGDE